MKYNFVEIDLKEKTDELIKNIDKNIETYNYKQLIGFKKYLDKKYKHINNYQKAKEYYVGYKVLKAFEFLVKHPTVHFLCLMDITAMLLYDYDLKYWIRNLAKDIDNITTKDIIKEFKRNLDALCYNNFYY